ncbi:MAG: hypothetical protein EPN73_14935 [Paraburkholderia sp.]|uniref:hypothetical protein n=1 Tax=Paraburkholderia sp. TaxID=1926495 RepID=UPI00121756FE|nr:hypothetical protein [Paraburkholderia sp.]TAL95055.1 MAG: hypothetical protein EPN73_14935 [Paraburkholderia sp.]
MTLLVITDLTESVELDRQAMAAIVGGTRIGAHHIAQPAPGAPRVVDYPPGFPAARQAPLARSGAAGIAASPSSLHP